MPERGIGKHLGLPVTSIIPLCAQRNLKWSHILSDIHPSHIECQRSDAVIFITFLRRGKVTMPGLNLGPLKRNIESNFYDLIVRPENSFSHSMHPWMSHQIDKSAQRLRVQLHIPSARPPADSATRPLYRLPKRGSHVFPKLLHPLSRKC